MWMKVDDRLHTHRKTRALTKTDPTKRRDAAPMGLWVLAGSWAGQNNTDGWVPEDELDRWDDEWEPLAKRLVRAGYWWPEERDGEPGYAFVDWHEYNPSHGASESGEYGNHVRWHVKRGVVEPSCEHCPKEPASDESAPEPDPESGGDIGGRSGGDIAPESRNVALPEPDPTRPEPDPSPKPPRASALGEGDETGLDDIWEGGDIDRFEEFWDTYGKKVGKKAAQQKWRIALKKPGVTADLLITAAAQYVEWQQSEGKHPTFTKDPARWLNGEHWNDERAARAPEPVGRVGQHMALVHQLAQAEHDGPRQIGGAR